MHQLVELSVGARRIGVVVSVSLVMVFAGLRDTVVTLIDRQYGRITVQDGEIATVPGATDSVLARVRQDPDVAVAEPVGRYDIVLSAGGRHYDTLVISLSTSTQMHRFTATSGSNQLSDNGLLLGSGLQDRLGISIGDTVEISDTATGHRFTAPVTGFVDEPLSPVVYVSTDSLRQRIGPVPATRVLVKLRPGVTDEQAVSDRLTAIPGAVAYAAALLVQLPSPTPHPPHRHRADRPGAVAVNHSCSDHLLIDYLHCE
ncbi:ABC transporter permease [Nocardia sp. CA-119907]|uniref:ABC transporter permease n=1 Tax=Nocardia sp. CA-119907 TaxID=3239973 RepID=UPI003D96C8E7